MRTTVHYGGAVDLTVYTHDVLPPLPEGIAPEVSYDFEDGKVNTTIEWAGEAVTFWESDMDGTINSLTDTLEPEVWRELDMETTEALLEWGKEVHQRIDSAIYGITIDACSNQSVRDAVIKHATTEAEEGSGDD